MKQIRLAYALLLTLWLSGCAAPSAPLSPPPEGLSRAGFQSMRSSQLDKEADDDVYAKFINKNRDILYRQNFGGAVAVGALFGPLGVLANIAMIKSNTEADAAKLQDQIRIDPAKLFQDAARQAKLDLATTPQPTRTTLSPYLFLSKTDNDVVLLGSALVVERGEGTNRWVGKYIYQLPITYTLQQLNALDAAQTTALATAATAGYAELIQFVSTESPEKAVAEPKISFRSDFVSPRFRLEQTGSLARETSSHQWVRDPRAIYAVRRENVEVQRTMSARK